MHTRGVPALLIGEEHDDVGSIGNSHGIMVRVMAVRIYSTPTCTFCDQLKSYLRTRSVKFVDYDVSRDDRKAGEMLNKSRQTAVPVLAFHGTIVVGFDKPKVDRLIAKYR